MRRLQGRAIKTGKAHGFALVSREPIGFLGGVDPETGVVIEPGHALEGQSIAHKVLVFSSGKGSTVGSYVLYRLAYNGLAPLAIINTSSEAVVAVGAIVSNIPMVDQIDIGEIRTGDEVTVDGPMVILQQVDRAERCADENAK
jgi:predicted aconitase with swiveling domain